MFSLSKNPLVAALGKPASAFTIDDIVTYVVRRGIEMVNFMYPAADGRLKTLNFVVSDLDYLRTILTLGERVDGSSLFPGTVSAGASDLYVVPRLRTAFFDPFAEIPTLCLLCSFFDREGHPFEGSPERTLVKACEAFTKRTGLIFQAMGELEFYTISADPDIYNVADQRGYHESAPFAKSMAFRMECMNAIASTGASIKYGHGEVGTFTHNGRLYEQNEIEFLPVNAPDAADQLMVAKWIIRNVAARRGLDVTFAPKITAGMAGSGLHVHMRLVDADGVNRLVTATGALTDDARRMIAGMMDTAQAITAFGNTNPTSYFRLVPNQEAPTKVCWGDSNRSALVRVPLGWAGDGAASMFEQANPGCHADVSINPCSRQTIEIRSADGSANIYLLIAALAVAVRHGFEMPDALEVARRTYVDVDIHKNAARSEQLLNLPADCAASADALEQRRAVFEADGVFSPATINAIEAQLRRYDASEIERALADTEVMLGLVKRYLHCG